MTASTETSLPLAGGVGGGQPHAPTDVPQHGHFRPRDTDRAKELRRDATPAERKLWRAISGSKLGGHKFSRQMPIGPYFADFLCRGAKLVVEIDGYSHAFRRDHDQLRDSYIVGQGFTILRFSNDDVMGNLDGVLQTIAIAPTEKCAPPTPPASGRGVKSAALLPSRLREGLEVGSREIAESPIGISLEGSVR